MVSLSRIVAPSSIESEAYNESTAFKLWRSDKSFNISRTASSAFSCTVEQNGVNYAQRPRPKHYLPYLMYACTTSRPYLLIRSFTSPMPLLLAATWARRSDKLSDRFRVPEHGACHDSRGILAGDINSSVMPSSWNWPSRTNLKALMHAPSSTSVLENGGIEPGEIPPISAWWPLLAT